MLVGPGLDQKPCYLRCERKVVSEAAMFPMDRATDLEAALSFVVRRIEEQAKASGRPLTAEQHSLIQNLPPSNVDYLILAPDLGPPELAPRNINLEWVRDLAKTAYLNDHEAHPASLDWQFALAVFALHHHPMWGLLRYAGLEYRRPLADQLLLIIAALPFLIVPLLLAWRPWTLFQSLGIGFGFVLATVWLYFASRRIQGLRLKQEIERCRLGSHFVTSTVS